MNPAEEPSAALVGGTILEARDLVLSFGETPALRGASVSVKRGEVVAVMGPSGSGKSTLLHCLAGILVPDRGEVWFGGQRRDRLSDGRRSAARPARGGVRGAAAPPPRGRAGRRAAPGPFRVRFPVRSARARTDRRGERGAAAA